MKTNVLLKLIGFTLSIFALSGFTMLSNSNINSITLSIQEEMVVNTVYDGHEEYGYNFIAKNKEGEEYTITFQEIKEELLKEFDLKSETLIGKSFSITYQTRIETSIDDDGFEDEDEVNTIIKLKKL
ncbi:hypothetical protein [Hwangdonia lutea]|uniref:Uncharacterized protein n=1 Tax=Hwangdonia lutea TaxID=3075823 RepID=A0AA97HRD8_9FLAO|nr:hypothetical protein [Hwangdonia sp. SCSIO 19198]WOD44507.1 hypothetical protein RNZ46_04440 [Hwangdonia sp. SCSIO 19198]